MHVKSLFQGLEVDLAKPALEPGIFWSQSQVSTTRQKTPFNSSHKQPSACPGWRNYWFSNVHGQHPDHFDDWSQGCRLTMHTQTEPEDHDFCLSRSHYNDTGHTSRKRGGQNGDRTYGILTRSWALCRPTYCIYSYHIHSSNTKECITTVRSHSCRYLCAQSTWRLDRTNLIVNIGGCLRLPLSFCRVLCNLQRTSVSSVHALEVGVAGAVLSIHHLWQNNPLERPVQSEILSTLLHVAKLSMALFDPPPPHNYV